MIRRIVQYCCLLTSLLLFSRQATGQMKPLEHALLWEIKGKGLDQPSFIYGTIHMICEKDFLITQKLKETMKHVDEIVFELNLEEPDLDMTMKAALTSPIPLNVRLGEHKYCMLDSVFSLKTTLALQELKSMELSALNMILSSVVLSCGKPTSYEKVLLAMAKENQKKISGFESSAEQLSFFKKAQPDATLFNQMMNMDNSMLMTEKMFSLYKLQDVNGLYALIDDVVFKKWILEVRNKNWLDSMPVIMKKNSTLFAVGAAHLGGDTGLINSLKKMGYLLTPMM